jgi:prepilin-type processing-associated H-X9-DG protein
LKQIGLAAKNHAAVHGYFPSSGWGFTWIGDPNRGFGKQQPGGWIYNSLPFMEQQNVHDLGLGLTGAALKSALAKQHASPLAVMNCPSRRRSILYPPIGGTAFAHNTDNTTQCAKTDYAGNGGEVVQTHAGPGSDTATEPIEPSWIYNHTGVTHVISQVRPAHITDGLTSTYWAGEKYLEPNNYTTGANGADNGSMYQGHDWDNLRWGNAAYPPRQDRIGAECWQCFGSAHAGKTNFVMCDGSVQSISNGISPDVHQRLGNRKDGSPVDVGAL